MIDLEPNGTHIVSKSIRKLLMKSDAVFIYEESEFYYSRDFVIIFRCIFHINCDGFILVKLFKTHLAREKSINLIDLKLDNLITRKYQ